MKNGGIVAVAILMGFAACQKEEVVNLSAQEQTDLVYLIQEEKLAHDVYVFAYEKYGEMIFNAISSSEQSHMDKVEVLMVKYSITNPIDGLGVGVFQNTELQTLYGNLIAIADSSLVHALKVGATIEDLDIYDIEALYANTVNNDLIEAYDVLTCGSRNHLRSFISNLDGLGEIYDPQYLSISDFNSIVSSEKENCGN